MADSSKKEKELGGRKMSTGTKIVVGIFAVVMALSMMLPSLAPIFAGSMQKNSSSEQAGQEQKDGQSDSEATKTAENKVCVLLTDALPGETPPETTEAPSGTDAPETEAQPAPEGETEPLATPTEPEPTEAPSETAPAVDTDALHAYAEDARKAAEADVLLVIHTPDKTAWIAGGDDAQLARVQAALASGGAYEAALTMFAE